MPGKVKSSTKRHSRARGSQATQRQARRRALNAVNEMRREDLSLTAAARKAKTTPATVRRYAGDSLTLRNQRWEAVLADRKIRSMYVNTGGHVVPVKVRGSRKASELSAYHNAVGYYLATGEADRLQPFLGKSVGGLEYETDLDVLDEMARRGQLSIESIYQAVG